MATDKFKAKNAGLTDTTIKGMLSSNIKISKIPIHIISNGSQKYKELYLDERLKGILQMMITYDKESMSYSYFFEKLSKVGNLLFDGVSEVAQERFYKSLYQSAIKFDVKPRPHTMGDVLTFDNANPTRWGNKLRDYLDKFK